jgi:hypothetical protein
MKRDMNLVREILIKLENHNEKEFVGYFTLEEYDDDLVTYHLGIMDDAGIIGGRFLYADDKMLWSSLKISWDGHEFLDAIKNENVWSKVKGVVQEKGGSIPFEILKALAIKTSEALFLS